MTSEETPQTMPAAAQAPTINLKLVEKILAKLNDKRWRIENLYLILDEDKVEHVFKMRAEQRQLFEERHTRNFIPKSRKLGISTFVVIDYLDDCLFAKRRNPVHAAHVDYRDDDAKKKLLIARYAYVNGPRHPVPEIAELWKMIHQKNPLVVDNAKELGWANGSLQQSNTSFMGGTPTRLHISEYGPLAATFPDRAEAVKRDTFNAATMYATIDIETTMQGGMIGECYAIFALAREYMGKPLSPLNWKMFFMPWWGHPSYIFPGCKPKRAATDEYFTDIQKRYGLKIDPARQSWWEDKQEEQGRNMFTQFPTVLDECLKAGTTLAFFHPDAIEWMRSTLIAAEPEYCDLIIQGDVKNYQERSVYYSLRDRYSAVFRIFEEPLEDESYLLWADFCGRRMSSGSTGERDTNAFGVLKAGRFNKDGIWLPPKVVAACMPDDRSNTPETIRRLVALHIYYGDCMTVPEINNKDDIADRMIAAGIRTMWKEGTKTIDGGQPGTNKADVVYGWYTSSNSAGEGPRKQMLDNMAEMTMQRAWLCSCPTILHQMAVFMVNEKGRPEAPSGEHDDWVIGPAIGLITLNHATKYRGRAIKMATGAFYEPKIFEDYDPRGI